MRRALALLALAPGCAAWPEATFDASDAALLASFAARDLYAVEQVLAARPGTAAGDALVADLSALVRCLPLPPPRPEAPPATEALRALVRHEAGLLHAPGRSPERQSFRRAALTYTTLPRDAERTVRWPIEAERWPGERTAAPVSPSSCAKRPPRPGPRVALHLLVPALPPALRAEVSYAALLQAETPTAALSGLTLDGLPPPRRSAGHLRLAALAERAAPDLAIASYRAVLDDPERAPAEDSRARTRLAGLLGDSAAIAAVVRPETARPEEASYQAYALASAHLAAGEVGAAIAVFSSMFRAPRGELDPYAKAAKAKVLDLALTRPAGDAPALLGEIAGPAKLAWLAELAERAIGLGDYERAAQLLELVKALRPVRVESRSHRARSARAEVAYLRQDLGGFAEELDKLAAAATDPDGARRDALGALRRLGDALAPRLKEDRRDSARHFVELLLRGLDRVRRVDGPGKAKLDELHAALLGLRAPSAGPRIVGRVVLARKAPELSPPDVPVEAPPPAFLLVYPTPAGLVMGAPWLSPTPAPAR